MKKHGQSIIEYILIAVLVILGIVIMGTYVLRSTNANFKLWDTGVQDSFREVLVQAPVNSIPPIPLNCTCTDAPLQCGQATGTSQCAGDERAYSHTCSPNALCDGQASSFCKYDKTCCQTYYKVGCGTIPIGSTIVTNGNAANNCNGNVPTTVTLDPGTICLGASASPANCFYGQRIEATQCSDLPIICVPDPTCAPTCTGISLIEGNGAQASALYCDTNSTTMPTGMDQDYPISYVAAQSSCPSPSPSNLCVMYCNQASGFIPFTSSGGVTSCIDQFPIAPPLNDCSGQPNVLIDHATCAASSTSCCGSDGSPTVTTVNNQNFTICPSDKNIAIKTVNISTSSTSSTCTSCACCTDLNANCSSPSQCTGQPATPSCSCTISMTVSNV